MAYSEVLADRMRVLLSSRRDVIEKKMFGGIAFMVAGSMACGIVVKGLMARVGPERYEAALSRPHARSMDFTGRPLRGFVLVDAAGIRTDRALSAWVRETVEFAVSLAKREKPGQQARARNHRRPRRKGATSVRKRAE